MPRVTFQQLMDWYLFRLWELEHEEAHSKNSYFREGVCELQKGVTKCLEKLRHLTTDPDGFFLDEGVPKDFRLPDGFRILPRKN